MSLRPYLSSDPGNNNECFGTFFSRTFLHFLMTYLLVIFMTILVYSTYLNIVAFLAFKYFTEKHKGSVSLCRFNNFEQLFNVICTKMYYFSWRQEWKYYHIMWNHEEVIKWRKKTVLSQKECNSEITFINIYTMKKSYSHISLTSTYKRKPIVFLLFCVWIISLNTISDSIYFPSNVC